MDKNFTNTETKTKLFEFIDNLIISKTEYDIILKLLENYDSKLFIKILEEIMNGKMQFIDFDQVFPIEQDKLEKSLKDQEEIYKQIVLLNEISNMTKDKNFDQLFTLSEDAIQIEKSNQIIDLIKKDLNDPLKNFYNQTVLQHILDNENSDLIDSMLMSIHDYIVPVDYDHISLTSYDINFANSNKISLEQMKKIKSLAAFATKYENK